MEMNNILNQMAVLFLILLTGYVAAKLNVVDDIANHRFSKFVIHLTAPALIISSVTGNNNLGSLQDMLTILLLSFGYFLVIPLLSLPLVKLLRVPPEDKNLYLFMFIFHNNVFMGFPVVKSLFGEGAVFYAAIFNFPNTLFLYTLGIYLVKRQQSPADVFEIRKIFNAGTYAIFLAVLLFIFKIQLPGFLKEAIALVGSITTPLSLMVIGASLSAIPLGEVLKEKKLYPLTLISLIGIPVMMLFLLKLFIFNEIIRGVLVVLAAMPVASLAVMFCNEYGGNTSLAAKSILFTTLFTIVNIPFLAFLIRLF
jgi:predicted permease